MIDAYLFLTPVLAAGVLALVGFVGCDKLLGFQDISPPPPAPTPIVDFTIDPNNPPVVRNDFSGWVGTVIQPFSDTTIVSLGRWCLSGNTGNHQVKIVDDTGTDVSGAIVLVPLASQTENTFVYADLASPILLTKNQRYFLVSQEQMNGDTFLDYPLAVVPSPDFNVLSAVFTDQNGPMAPYTLEGTILNSYGPVSGLY
jgi:hypothetical protein